MPNETLLGLVFAGLGVYFGVLLLRGLLGYLHFRRLLPTALLTWPVPRPRAGRLLFSLGLLSLAITALNGYMARPLHHVASLGLMALYFLLMVPLAGRIRLGFYEEGVWADAGFLPWGRIARMAFREHPDIVLILLPRGGRGSFRLPVPADEYGAARKLIEEKVRARVVNMEGGILGL
ncbi:MAG TPA: hypothetical protein VIC87_03665 [Vicinamibacteria bacterium]|jgi:hypothetical protein